MIAWFDLLVDVQDLSVFANVECPAERELAFAGHDAISLGDFALGITQDRIIQAERLSELFIRFGRVTTCCKVSHVEGTNVLAALTERLALGRSAPGECLGIPGNHDRLLVLEVGQFVGFAVAAWKLEFRSRITLL